MSLSPTGSARQLSLFGVEAADPSPDDLAGLLAGPGRLVRMGGTARVSVVVDGAWRVHVLVAELTRRGLTASWESVAPGRLAVRTAYTSRLARVARVWVRDGAQRPPTGFFLDGHRLRLWVAAAGVAEPDGFVLPLGADSVDAWRTVAAALAAVGLAATLLPAGPAGAVGGATREGAGDGVGTEGPDRPAGTGGADGASPETLGAADAAGGTPGRDVTGSQPGAAFRIVGRRRLARLAELVGPAPPTAPAQAWPGG